MMRTIRKFYIVFEAGNPEGVIFTDSKGTLFGDKAAILLTGQEAFELFDVSQSIVSALASRCRIFDKSHIMKRLDDDLPSFGGIHRSPGILCLTLAKKGVPQQGIRVSIKKGRADHRERYHDHGREGLLQAPERDVRLHGR